MRIANGLRLSALASSLLLSSCGMLTTQTADLPGGNPSGANLGCIQGAIVDGLTGARVKNALQPTGKSVSGINVIVRGNRLAAQSLAYTADETDMLSSEYMLCNIPLDETYPIFVNINGYQTLEGEVYVPSTAPARSKEAVADLKKLAPTATVNVRVYPLGTNTEDLKIHVTSAGAPVADAMVELKATGSNALDSAKDEASHFLQPRNFLQVPVQLKTDAKGLASFDKKILVLGGSYQYRVLPPGTATERSFAEGSLVVGLMAQAGNPYDVYVDLKDPRPGLLVVSQSNPLNVNPQGEVRITYNREFEFVPGTIDKIAGVLSGANGATLRPENPGNSTPDAVNATIDGTTLVLTPNFLVAPDAKREQELTITYSGIVIRAKNAPATASNISVPSASMKFFGGINTPAVATSIAVQGDSAVSGSAGGDVTSPLQVKVVDQFGQPFVNAVVIAKVTSGGGGVRPYGASGSGSAQSNVTTDSTGIARIAWKLGTREAQIVEVWLGTYASVTFTATAGTNATSLEMVSSLPANALTDTDLPNLDIVVKDQNGQVFSGPLNVVFSLSNGDVGLHVGDRNYQSMVTVPTVNGRARISWHLSAREGRQTLTVAAGALSRLTFNVDGKVVPNSLNINLGNNQTAKPDSELVDAISVQVLDHLNNPIATPTDVTFRIASALGGTLRDPATSSTAAAIVVKTGLNGLASVRWKVGTPGEQRVVATVKNVAGQVEFVATAK